MNDKYKYNKSLARFYDVVYDKILNSSGFDFYCEEISRANGPVLEVGAGTGRIFVPSLKNRADIYGIEQSEFMLDMLKAKINKEDHHRVSVQDVRQFSLDKKFRLIISPFRVFQHLTTVEEQLKAINKIYEHLETGGRFIFDVFAPDLKRIVTNVEDLPEFDGEYEPGKRLQRFASIIYDNVNQILNLTFKFVWDEDGEKKTEECFFPLRYYHRYELENLIGRTNLKLEKIYGGFDRSEIDKDSKEFIVVCFKP